MKRPAPHVLMGIVLSTWLSIASNAMAKDPDCTHPNAWPSGMAFTYLKNAGVLRSEEVDFTKTSVARLASERVGKNLYRQVHLVRFMKTTGEQVSAIAVNEVSRQECSMSGVDVYLVSQHLGDYSGNK